MNTTAAPDNIMRCNENEAALSLCIMSHNKASSSPPPSASSRPPAVLVSLVPPSPPAAASPAPVPTALPSPPPVVQNKVRVRNCKAPTQNGTVAIEEMTRLMRVYGPIKSIRSRAPSKTSVTKVMSIKRKFYRWFPDFSERFVRTPEGWYRPLIGHEAEMKYRAAMRDEDEMELISLRATKRRENHLKKKAAEQLKQQQQQIKS